MMLLDKVGVVVIGRNEGERLDGCLGSLSNLRHRVYVDSGSTDNSVAMAEARGMMVRRLQSPPNYTAARARNAGIQALSAVEKDLEFVLTVDGDCEVQPDWVEAGVRALVENADLALVFGRRRERYPDRSVYNALCDDEWNVAVGDAAACGGDVLFRLRALQSVGGYRDGMIAGEDPELSMRLRKQGWRLSRINAEMTVHDAAIVRFRQWWQRAKRSGYGYGDLAYRHPDATDPNWTRSCISIALWGGMGPVLLLLSLASAVYWDLSALYLAMLVAGLWTGKVLQIFLRQRARGLGSKLAGASALLLMIGKVAQFQGLLRFASTVLSGRSGRLIEYK